MRLVRPEAGLDPASGSAPTWSSVSKEILGRLIPGDLILYESEEGDWYGIVIDVTPARDFTHSYEMVWISPRGDRSDGDYSPEDLPMYFDLVQDAH